MSNALGYSSAMEYVRYLRRRKEQIACLVSAFSDYLYDNIDNIIEDCLKPPPPGPRPTIDDLNRAQEKVDLAQASLDSLNGMCDDLPESTANFMRQSQIPPIQKILELAKNEVSSIQKQLEAPEYDPANPWPGTHRISTLCAQCATPYDGIESSIPLLVKALKAAGWGRDPNGDHICPDCAAKPAGLADTSTSAETSTDQKESL